MDTDWKKITLFGSAMRSHAKLWFQLYVGQRDEDALLPTDLVSAEELKIRNNEFSSFMDALDLKFKDPLLISNAQVWVTTASQGSMPFDDYVTLFMTNVLRARYNADHQIMRFIECINPSIRRVWRPKDNTIPLSLAACISDIRHGIQTNAILNPPTPRHNVGPNLSGSQDVSLPRQGITSSHLLTSSKVWDDPSKPGPFTVNLTTPTYKLRESKGWCLRCGMSSHSTEKCRIYPTTLSNAENYETGKRKVAAYKNQSTPSLTRVHVSSLKQKEGAPSTPVMNSTQIDSTDFYFDGLSGINQTMRPYAPHFMIPFSVVKVDTAEVITGKALIDSGASKSYMSRDFAILHGSEMVKLVHPVRVILADGKQQQSITHTTTPLEFTINQHSETLVAGIFNTKSYDVILGLNWLTFHSPSIDWELRTIKFSWDQQHEKAFEKIKELVKADVFLTFPDFTKSFYISFDAKFYSRKWSTTEWNYSILDKELYALILSLQHWYHWLVGATENICYTDHKSLRDFSKTQLLKPRHARWALTLEEFRSRLKIRWIPGSRNIVADALSRDPRFQLSAAEALQKSSQRVLNPEIFDSERSVPLNVLDSFCLLNFDEDRVLEVDDIVMALKFDLEHLVANEEDAEELMEDEDSDDDEFAGLNPNTTASIRFCQPHQRDISNQPDTQRLMLQTCHDGVLAGH
ncbi:hypothetical protein SeLEV6574_g06342 [Synchytrium endobioticum]|uniref:Reverse transcriptase RNase H-like domain-containing protein n=1 Tax=Synchytrium endobioticum TaxID=286115 RepID=A0A507CP50_9FUNG|nr:hypothetical protein SeLEV6574_g06342 [Synchytrium endobioticum]